MLSLNAVNVVRAHCCVYVRAQGRVDNSAPDWPSDQIGDRSLARRAVLDAQLEARRKVHAVRRAIVWREPLVPLSRSV